MKDDYDEKALEAFRNDLCEFDKDYNAENSKEKMLLAIFDNNFWLPGYREAAARVNRLSVRYYNILKLRSDRFYWMSESNFDSITPFEFEELIGELLNKMGYETEVTSKSGDYGIDVIARKGKDVVAVQVKKYAKGNNVGNQEVQKLLGSMQLSTLRANKGILATTSDFTVHAIEQAKGTPIEFWNGDVLVELFNKYYKDSLDKLPADLLNPDPINYAPIDITTYSCPKCKKQIFEKATKCKSCDTPIMWLQGKPQIKPDFLKGSVYGCIGIIVFIACLLFIILAVTFIVNL